VQDLDHKIITKSLGYLIGVKHFIEGKHDIMSPWFYQGKDIFHIMIPCTLTQVSECAKIHHQIIGAEDVLQVGEIIDDKLNFDSRCLSPGACYLNCGW
jgi:hypothetical protein